MRFCSFVTLNHGSAKAMELIYIFQPKNTLIQGIGFKWLKVLEERVQLRDYRNTTATAWVCAHLSRDCLFSHHRRVWLPAGCTVWACGGAALGADRPLISLHQGQMDSTTSNFICLSLKEPKPRMLLAKESEKGSFQASSPYDKVRA